MLIHKPYQSIPIMRKRKILIFTRNNVEHDAKDISLLLFGQKSYFIKRCKAVNVTDTNTFISTNFLAPFAMITECSDILKCSEI
jgi:hypothetical protein